MLILSLQLHINQRFRIWTSYNGDDFISKRACKYKKTNSLSKNKMKVKYLLCYKLRAKKL